MQLSKLFQNPARCAQICRRAFSFAVLAGLLTGSCYGQAAVAEKEEKAESAVAEDLPSVDEILADNLKANGGREKFEQLKSLVMKGEMEMPGMKADLTIYQKADGSFLFHADIPQIGEIKRCKKGDFAWETNPMAGPRILTGDELSSFEREADLAASLHLDKYYKEKTCVGTEEIDGKKCYKVVMVTKDGNKETNFYEADSKLMVRTIRKQKTAMGDIPVTANISDYRESKGFVFPFLTKNAMMGMEQIMRVKEIMVDEEIDDSIFDAPEEVLMLKKKQEERAKKKAEEGPDAQADGPEAKKDKDSDSKKAAE